MKKEHSTTRSVIFTPHNTRKIAENKKIMVGYECTLGKKELLKTEISIYLDLDWISKLTLQTVTFRRPQPRPTNQT